MAQSPLQFLAALLFALVVGFLVVGGFNPLLMAGIGLADGFLIDVAYRFWLAGALRNGTGTFRHCSGDYWG